MHRFLPAIILLQIVTIAIFWLNSLGSGSGTEGTANPGFDFANPDLLQLLKVGIPCLLLAVISAFWFSSIARALSERTISKMKEHHARDREKIQVNAERAKTKLVEKTQKEITKQTRKAAGKANFKVSLAFMGAAVAGVFMIIVEMMTMGLMTLMTAGGALGGYVARGRRESRPVATVIENHSGHPVETDENLMIENRPEDVVASDGRVKVINPDA